MSYCSATYLQADNVDLSSDNESATRYHGNIKITNLSLRKRPSFKLSAYYTVPCSASGLSCSFTGLAQSGLYVANNVKWVWHPCYRVSHQKQRMSVPEIYWRPAILNNCDLIKCSQPKCCNIVLVWLKHSKKFMRHTTHVILQIILTVSSAYSSGDSNLTYSGCFPWLLVTWVLSLHCEKLLRLLLRKPPIRANVKWYGSSFSFLPL